MTGGWIKLHRQALGNPMWHKPNYAAIWVYILLHANHAPREVVWNNKKVVIERSAFIGSKRQIADFFGLSIATVSYILKYFQVEHMIEQSSNKRFTYFKVLNYEKYQDVEHNIEIKLKSKLNQIETNKNDKKGKNEEEYKNAAEDGDVVENLLEGEKGGIQHDYQYLGLEIYEKTGAPKEKKAECIRIARDMTALVPRAMSFCLDYPNPALKWKMFLWKLQELRKNAQTA